MVIRRLAGCGENAVTAEVTAAVNEYINNGLGVANPLIIPRLYAVAYNADPELAKTDVRRGGYLRECTGGEQVYEG